MKNKKWLFNMIAGALILICATCIFAQDWSQWRGNNRDGKVSGFKVPENWPGELSQEWKVAVFLRFYYWFFDIDLDEDCSLFVRLGSRNSVMSFL